MSRFQKGFTLIELLVVIAIIALLVSIVVPTVSGFLSRANAAADAANLKSVLDIVNTELASSSEISEVTQRLASPVCKTDSSAKIKICYGDTVGLNAYYVTDSQYFSIPYLADVAANGTSSRSTAMPSLSGEWYEVGTGKLDE